MGRSLTKTTAGLALFAAIPCFAGPPVFSTMEAPQATSTQVLGITGAHGFIDDNSVYTVLDDPDALPGTTQAIGINNSGDVIGTCTDASGNVRSFFRDSSAYTTLNSPGAVLTQAFGISDPGEIVGSWSGACGQSHGFPDEPNGAARTTQATGNNGSGEIIGYFPDAQRNSHSFAAVANNDGSADTPEPGTTLLLAGTALLIVAASRTRRRRP